MANYRAIANGDWSDLAIREDNSSGSLVASSVLPWINDIVYSNNYTIEVDQDVEVKEIRNTVLSWTAVAGGGFTITSNNDIEITADLMYCHGVAGMVLLDMVLLDISSASVDNEITLNANINAGLQGLPVQYDGSGTLNINGSVSWVSYTSSSLSILRGWCIINLVGTIYRHMIDSRSSAISIRLNNDKNKDVNLNIFGIIEGGLASSCHGIRMEPELEGTAIKIKFEGIITSTGVTGCPFWIYGSTIDIELNDSIIEWDKRLFMIQTSGHSYGANSKFVFNNCLLHQTGDEQPLIYMDTLSNQTKKIKFYFNDTEIQTDSIFPLRWRNFYFNNTKPKTRKLRCCENNPIYMYNSYVGNPTELDVRDWTLYGGNLELEWSLKVPAPDLVAKWVPTDDTIGTADFQLDDINSNLAIINDWIKKASLSIPHNQDLV